MKFVYLFCLLFSPILLRSQNYEIPLSDVSKADLSKYVDHSVDVSAKNWKEQAFITFTGIDQEFQNIEVMPMGTSEKITGMENKDENTAVFALAEAFIKKQNAFDIYYKKKKIGTVEFELKNIDKINLESNDADDDEVDPFKSYVGALASANFVGNNKFLSNLTPAVNLGGVVPLVTAGWFSWEADVNPYVAGEIDTKDSVSFIPALMLYGRAGFVFNNYFNFKLGKQVNITCMPFGFGLKFIPNLQDSGHTVIQHAIRGGLALRYGSDFLLNAQITHAWHNLTTDSKKNFQKIFSTNSTDMDYITVLAQLGLRGKDAEVTNYVYFEWRGLLSKERYTAFSNNAILTLGLRKTLEIGPGGSSRFQPTSTKKVRNRSSRRVMHFNL
jgi:hypothetical protein